MAVSLSPFAGAGWQFFDNNGVILSGGKLYVYAAGTTSSATTYTSVTGSTANTNPIILNSSGRLANEIWLTTGLNYKFILKTSADVLIGTWDNIPAGTTDVADLQAALASSTGAGMIGYTQGSANAVATTVQAKLRETVSVKDFGQGNEIGALLQAAIDSGAKSIEIPDASNWIWETPVVIPVLWRGKIYSNQAKSNPIIARTGHNYPLIDAQGALFVDLDGIVVTANDNSNTAPACFVVFARMPSGASSSNHRVSNCLIEGPFYYCALYNVGGEELNFLDNYWSVYGCANTITYNTAAIVHTLNEDSYFSGIITKASRTHAVSTSAIKHVGDVVKNANEGGSALVVGPNVNDISFELTYGYTSDNSNFLTLTGYYDNIMLGANRVEATKTSHIVYAPNDFSAGKVSIYKGTYLRSGSVDLTKAAVHILGTTATSCALNIASSVTWTTSSIGLGNEDTNILYCEKKLQCDISFLNAGQFENFSNTIVNVASLSNSSITMGLSSNLTCGSFYYGNYLQFFADPISSKASEVLYGGLKFGSTSNDANALDYYKEGSYSASFFGMSGSGSATIYYTRIGNTVTLRIPNITGTSNDVLFNLLNLPAEITPTGSRYIIVNVIDNGIAVAGSGLVNLDSVIYLCNNITQTLSTWTNSGTKGVYGTTITYQI